MPTSKRSGFGAVDLADGGGGELAVVEITVMAACQRPAGKERGGGGRGAGDRRLVAAEEEIAMAFRGGGAEQLRHQVGAGKVVADAEAVEPGGPADARAVAEDVVGRVEHFAIVAVGGRQVERVGVDEEDAAGRPGLLLQHLGQQRQGPAARDVGDPHAQEREGAVLDRHRRRGVRRGGKVQGQGRKQVVVGHDGEGGGRKEGPVSAKPPACGHAAFILYPLSFILPSVRSAAAEHAQRGTQ